MKIFKSKKNFYNKSFDNNGFTLIEISIYLFITIVLMLTISTMIMSIFDARKQLQASHTIHHNARFIINFLSNRIHNVDIITDVSPEPEEFHFYQLPNIRFSIDVEDGNLVYRQVEDTGTGFADQSTATPLILNADMVEVSNLNILSISDAHGNANKGINIDFILTVGSPGNSHGYLQKSFSTFLSIR